jgi:hypothetical protein
VLGRVCDVLQMIRTCRPAWRSQAVLQLLDSRALRQSGTTQAVARRSLLAAKNTQITLGNRYFCLLSE